MRENMAQMETAQESLSVRPWLVHWTIQCIVLCHSHNMKEIVSSWVQIFAFAGKCDLRAHLLERTVFLFRFALSLFWSFKKKQTNCFRVTQYKQFLFSCMVYGHFALCQRVFHSISWMKSHDFGMADALNECILLSSSDEWIWRKKKKQNKYQK